MKNFKFSTLLLAPLFAILTACGGGGGGSSSSSTSSPGTVTLKSIAVTIPSSTIQVGAATPTALTATATYSDGSSKVLTAAGGLSWSTKSGTTNVLQVFSNGTVQGKAVGSETVVATQDSVTGSVLVTVTAPWAGVAAGGDQTIARKADGNLYAWGSNIQGQLGDSTTTNRNAPVTVNNGTGTTPWIMVSVGDQFAVGIRKNATTSTTGTTTVPTGTLWAWGYNQNGQLGDGTQINHSVPVQIGKDTDWMLVSAGKSHVLALKASGALYAWGRNFNGQLGDGTTIGHLTPTKIGTALWNTVSAGGAHSLGIQKDLSLWTWGSNSDGQLGNAAAGTDVPLPTKIGSLTFSSVSAGAYHSMAISANGGLYGWGQNSYGQLGNNGSSMLTAPTPIGTKNNWAVVAAGTTHTMGVQSDGTLWGWGSNAEGQLGDGNGDELSPTRIGTDNTWTTVAVGTAHSFGLKTDNTLWGWGRNAEGQLGNGSNLASPIPVSIPY